MKKKNFTRRNFLKVVGRFSLGALLLPLGKSLKQSNDTKLQTPMREAKFYKSSDHLAG